MCSIFCIFNCEAPLATTRAEAVDLSSRLRHRGPDWSGVYESNHALMAHERLSIVDIDSGAQPLYANNDNYPGRQYILAVNGEIYNHKQLSCQLKTPYAFKTNSDCEIILALYQECGTAFLNSLRGMFAFALYDEKENSYLIARDPLGIIPLYIGYDRHGQFFVASEMKALTCVCDTVEVFPPGHYLVSKTQGNQKDTKNERPDFVRYYQPEWNEYTFFESGSEKVRQHIINSEAEAISAIRTSLNQAVKSHLMADVPYGVLLSGGLDSSVIAAITKQLIDQSVDSSKENRVWWPKMHTFAVGLEGSPDLVAAQTVADHLGTSHHTFTYTEQEGLDALRQVIYHLETYDVTTIRASTPMFLMARKIRASGIKMVLSGEGSDELFGGYLYFHKAPSPRAFHEETVRKLQKLHLYDCLRANKAMMAWSIEARVPFLDRDFIDTAMRIHPQLKMITPERMEKYLLRRAFEDLLPASVVWRQKEQFSDGVGYSWIDSLQGYAEMQVSDSQLARAPVRFPVNTPHTKEGYLYRELFEQQFPQPSALTTVPGGKSVACSTPEALLWDKSLEACVDPSGRAVSAVHQHGYK